MNTSDVCEKFGLQHIFWALVLVAYSILGAVIFQQIEGPKEQETKEHDFEIEKNNYEQTLRYRHLLKEIGDSVIMGRNESHYEALEWLMNSSLPREAKFSYKSRWSFLGSFFYCCTIYTTIGYGRSSAVTTVGRLATIIYALIGIPLILTILSDWGTVLFIGTKHLWNFLVSLLRKCNKNCLGGRIKGLKDLHLERIRDKEGDLDAAKVPLSLAGFLLIFWICACAAFYCFLEKWDYFTSFYFFFISLTTIGLGDVTPQHAYPGITVPCVLIGLAVVGLSFNIIQAKVEAFFDELEDSIEATLNEAMRGEGNLNLGAKEGVKAMTKQETKLSRRVMVKLMGYNRLKKLEKKWEKKAAHLGSKLVQTELKTCDFGCQVDRKF